MNYPDTPNEAALLIQKHKPQFTPRIGIILGSGSGSFADQIEDKTVISYADIPGFPISTVAGHAGQLILGTIKQIPVACLKGRAHLYEGVSPQTVKLLVRTLKALGCSTLLITNASGSLRADVIPGDLMLITDHINFQPGNPLIGPNDDEFGPRFVSMDNAYDQDLRARLLHIADQLNIKLAQGVYISTLGPIFETPAEIRAFRTLGADAVGMSTVPEVIIARHCGLRVAVLAGITNLAAGMSDETLSHEGTLYHAQMFTENLTKLLCTLIEEIGNDV